MILTESYVRKLADQVLAHVDAPADSALLLEGSIAEGFGNSGSDIDFLLVCKQEADMPTMPSIFFIDGRRVEIRTRTIRQVTEHLKAVAAFVGSTPRRIVRLDEHLLNRCQRFLRGHIVRNSEVIHGIRKHLALGDFATVMTHWWEEHARQSARYAVCMLALGQAEVAAVWAKASLLQAAKSFAARAGETYLEPKWISLQLHRMDDDERIRRYWEVTDSSRHHGSSADHAMRCISLVHDLGVRRCENTPQKLVVDRASDVTTWRIGDRVHLVRNKEDVFVLGQAAAVVWRHMVWQRPVATIRQAAATAGVEQAGTIIAVLARYGLIQVTWQGTAITPVLPMASPGGTVTPRPAAVDPPLLDLRGATASSSDAIDLVAVPARRFGAAAMAMVWGNIMVENAIEDMRGALDRQQWRVAELTARRAVDGGLRALLSACGVNPLPPDAELIHRGDMVGPWAREILSAAEQLHRVGVSDPVQGKALLERVNYFVSLIRAVCGADSFPASFDSASNWQTTLDISYDWLRLGAYLDAAIPIEEARDLLSSGGAQPYVAPGASRGLAIAGGPQ